MAGVTPPPSSWKESLSQLKELLNERSKPKVEKCCANILQLDKNAASEADASHALPNEVRALVTTIYLRALIHSGKFAAVVDHCDGQSTESRDGNALEEAYALYRLRKYDACRKLCSRHVERHDKIAEDNYRGIMHIYAQTLYRMGETREADALYRKILDRGESQFAEMDADEREDALANALANCTANYTAGSLLLSKGVSSWVERVEEIASLLQSYGTDNTSPNSKEEQEDILQNYDLAYNLATYLLVSSDARPRRSIVQAKRLLTHAEKSALTVLESTSSPNHDDDENTALNEEERANKQQLRKQQQQQLAEREAMPIRANLAYANLLLGGDENEKDAMRTFLTCLMEGAKQKKGKGGTGGVEANLLAAASNNLAFLRDGKESVFDVLKRIPTACSSSVSEDGGAGKGGGGTSAVPLVGATPQQVRTVLYNRALQLAKMGNASGCLEALAVLRASLKVSYRGDDGGDEGNKASGGSASPKRNAKGKKKKAAVTSDSTNDASNEISLNQQDVPTAQPSSDVEAIAWNARADWVESELRRIIRSDNKKPDEIINSAISSLDLATKSNENDEAAGALAYTKAQLLLHNAALTNGQTKARPLIHPLESLPPLIQACPGTNVTLASLHGALNKEESISRSVEIMSSLGDDIPAQLAIAEFYLERCRYDDSFKLLEGVLGKEDLATTDQFMTASALIVRALSYTDPEKAEGYAEGLREACTESGLDGEQLESMEIPRFAKAVGPGNGGKVATSSSKVRKIIASTGSKKGSNRGEQNNKKNREAILRKRAKLRDAYLKELESKGLYDPNKVPQTKPDPERWIPKSQRSYNRRGRRGRYNANIGAQGGGAGAGMEKDAAKLDVAARVAAAKAGATDGAGKLSTASMQVSGGPVKKGKPGKRR
ncbi:hypothetical protein HJC23_007841 [Cyclotella cryptica]|uniref:Signal recognition particle subunit SRP72 n=1 Tax=Cyclotella cryptica TaxID=29204 RepID=A0ABD3R011_9STRA|eukprot:CCRYP_000148-RA/>CCRYP_000148-RA protein AED:0.01 eAED:0.01 QI:221/1/1/1/1/1/2/860/895